MVEKAVTFSPEQVEALLSALGTLIFVNAGNIITMILGYLLKNRKMRKDLNEAFRRIKKLENQKNPEEGQNESVRTTLSE